MNGLLESGKYDEFAKQVMEMKLSVQIFDVFGEKIQNDNQIDMFTASESDLDRQLRVADAKMGGCGFHLAYGRKYIDFDNPNAFKVDCILFAFDSECISKLNQYAEKKFHELNDQYRKYVVSKPEKCQKQYSDIVANGDEISKHNFSEHAECAVWDYTESLIVDRESESIEHIQNIGSGCSVSRKYKVEGGVESLLEDMDAKSIFDHIEGNPENVVVDPLETIDYTIKVISQKGNEKLIQGTYDKKGLPDDWAEFMESVFEFMSFYGWGEIMNPSVYGKVRRCDNDMIYCSVEFEDGCKSYYYISDDDSVQVGDFVIVPAGKDNHEAVVEVVKKEYFAEENVPLPMGKTKHIVRKCTENDLGLPDNESI